MDIFLRLWPDAPVRVNIFPLPVRLFFGMLISFFPFSYAAVNVSCFFMVSGVPTDSILPPYFPAPGPMSIT